jgi:hypothetical protein
LYRRVADNKSSNYKSLWEEHRHLISGITGSDETRDTGSEIHKKIGKIFLPFLQTQLQSFP